MHAPCRGNRTLSDSAESIGESAVRTSNRNQKKEPSVPKRKTNRSMTKAAIVKYVASKNEVTQNKVHDIFRTLEDLALRDVAENGTFTIPDMVRLITK